MKNFLPVIAIVLSLVTSNLSAQVSPLPGLSEQQKAGYEKMIKNIEHPPAYYTLSEANKWRYDLGMHKAKSLKTKAWLLVAAGAVIGGAGFLVPSNGSDYTKPAFFGVGVVAIGTGIICFNIAKKRKLAAGLILTNPPPAVGSSSSTSYFKPQVTLTYNL